MSLNNIKYKLQAQRGFTIVELLIVIVVIGILAAITLVSYNGVTTRANAASAKATAATVQKKAEIYQADGPTGKYPIQASDFTSVATTASYYMSNTNPNWSFSHDTGTLSAGNGTNTVVIRKCAASGITSQGVINSTNITGLQINYWDYNNSVVSTILVGSATNCPPNV